MNGIVISPKCRICSKHRHRDEFVLNPIVGYCLYCHASHAAAMDAIANNRAPDKCAECNTAFAELSGRTPNGDVRMTLAQKDGVHAFLCQSCSDTYDRQQAQRFRGTPYGAKVLNL